MTGPAPSTVVLVAHGSRAEAANAAHRALAGELAARTGRRVIPAFLELAEPSIGEAVDAAVAGGGPVLVLPHFLHAGAHVREDVPALVATAAARHPGCDVRVLAPFGDDPAVLDLLAAQLDRS